MECYKRRKQSPGYQYFHDSLSASPRSPTSLHFTTRASPYFYVIPHPFHPIQVPVRGRHCPHTTCFDLSSYLRLRMLPSSRGKGERAWTCPVCRRRLLWSELICDGQGEGEHEMVL